jgi:hypothetical protein
MPKGSGGQSGGKSSGHAQGHSAPKFSSGKAAQDNRANQMNPTYAGHSSGYHGAGTRADLNNHSNQLNPTNPRYK